MKGTTATDQRTEWKQSSVPSALKEVRVTDGHPENSTDQSEETKGKNMGKKVETNDQETSDSGVTNESLTSTGRLAGGRTATGYRVVHVAVPDEVFNHAKAQSFLFGMPWSKFITETLRNCEQLNPNRLVKEEK